MGSFSDWTENKILDHIFNTAWTPSPDTFLALCTAAVVDADTGSTISENSGSGYARKEITAWTAAAGRSVSNSAKVIFDAATGDWSSDITHWALCSASTAGNVIAYGSFASSVAVLTDNVMIIKIGELEISFDASALTNYLAHKLLDFIFSGTAYATPAANLHLGLSTTDPTDAGTSHSEPGSNYARKPFTSWDAAAAGVVQNDGDITFVTPTGAWGTVGWVFIADALTAGNLLIYDPITAQTIGVGNPFEILDEDAVITAT